MNKRAYFLALAILAWFGTGLAQIDPGTPDTVRVGTATATFYGQQVVISVFGYNSENLAAVSIPLKFNGSALIPDSVSFIGGRLTSASLQPVTIDTAGQTVFFGALFFVSPLTAGSGLFGKVYFTVKDSVPPDTVDIDTFFQPPATLSFIEPNTNEFIPQFVGGKVFVNVPGPPVPHDPVLTVPGPQQVFAGFNIAFGVTATDIDTGNVLTITKTGPGTFSHVPKKSPASGLFSWTTTAADTLGSPHIVTFIVNDGTGRADTGEVSIEVLPFITPPAGQDGDVDGDGDVDLEDVVYLINFIFNDGPPPNPLAAGDINGDCFVTIADVVYLNNYIFKSGPAPEPFCLPGDVNHDGYVNLPDIVYFVNYLLLSGPEPVSKKSADVNADCKLDLADIVYLVNFIFKGGPIPLPGCAVSSASLVASLKAAVTEMGLDAARTSDNVLEINLDLNLPGEAAALMLKIEYDPSKLMGQRPRLTSRTENMTLHYNDKGFQQTIGLVDLMGNNSIAPGTGTVLVLRFQVLDQTKLEQALKITFSEVVARDASPFEVRLVKGIKTNPELDK